MELVRFTGNDATLMHQLADCYIHVFSSEPWNECKRCVDCDIKWGLEQLEDESYLRHLSEHPDSVTDFWSHPDVLSDLEDEITAESTCFLFLEDSQVVGFAWGYEIETAKLLIKLDIDQLDTVVDDETVFYIDEVGLIDAYRGQSLATRLYEAMMCGAEHTTVLTRTKTNPPTVLFEWFQAKLSYRVVHEYNDEDGRVIMQRPALHSAPST